MKDFIKRLSSRKFLVTIAGIVGVTLYPQHADNIIFLIVTFVGAEGAADAVGRFADTKYVQPVRAKETEAIKSLLADDDDDEVDRAGDILPGSTFRPTE